MTAQYGSLSFDEAIQFFQKKRLVQTPSFDALFRSAHATAFTVRRT